MAKARTIFVCQSCGANFSKWQGKCNSCGEWNSLVEERVVKSKKSGTPRVGPTSPISLKEISTKQLPRIPIPLKELNRVFGGGIVPGSLTLIAGEPGIGKSTLSLQLALQSELKVCYISGEESEFQLKMRAERLSGQNSECLIYTETNAELILESLHGLSPDLVIIDSIQTVFSEQLESSAGSVSQIRESSALFLNYAKTKNVPVLLIGHVTKEGNIAGPKVLEHMVDTVLNFEGERNHVYRLVRTVKNRFGSTNELGIFEMTEKGLVEVENPSKVLLGNRDDDFSGIAISASIEGLRPILIETQALVSSAVYGTPQRSATGFDIRRLNMLLAILEKRMGFSLGSKDVFLNLAGGIRLDDPALDLSIMAAILSSSGDIPISKKSCFAGEVGLSGEIRPVNRLDQRIKEADKLGFERIYVSGYSKFNNDQYSDLEVKSFKRVRDVFADLFA